MYGVNMERARALMQTVLCTNGNCSQVNCLLRHLDPPVVDRGGVGILDRAENKDVGSQRTNKDDDLTGNEEDVMMKVIEESRRLACTCKFCGMIMTDEDSLQLHYVSCAEIGENDECHSTMIPRESQRSWEEQEEIEDRERGKQEEKEEKRRKESHDSSYHVPMGAGIEGAAEVMEQKQIADELLSGKMAENMAKRKEQLKQEEEQGEILTSKVSPITIKNDERPRRQKKMTWKMKLGLENVEEKKQPRKVDSNPGCEEEMKGNDSNKTGEEGESCTIKKNNEKEESGGDENDEGQKDIACYWCAKSGHQTRSCPKRKSSANNSGLQSEKKGEEEDQKNATQKRVRFETDDDTLVGGDEDSSDQEDSDEEMNEIKERLEKKETIIKDQTNQIEEMKKELRESRLKIRDHIEKEKKLFATLLDKDESIRKMNAKLSELSTREMQNLKEKVKKKKISQGVQTDCEEENKLVNSFSILDKLPSMKNKTHETNASITGKKFLNINTARGQHDRCFNCFDLEKKIKDLTKKNALMKKQISEYQESLGRANGVEARKATGNPEEKLDTSDPIGNENELRKNESNDAVMGTAGADQTSERGVMTQSGNVKKMDE